MSGQGNGPRGRYGKFLWGSVEGAEPPRKAPKPRRPERVEHPTDEEALGTGFALNPAHLQGYDWDLRVDSTGALMLTTGIDEYVKDLAFQTASESGELRGDRMTANAIEDTKLLLQRVLEADPRTKTIRRLGLQPSDRDADTLLIDLSVVVEDDEYHPDVIFPVRNTPQ